jgi:tRNA(fMet)-specific endonuclease VapC
MYLLDTNICIALFNKNPQAIEFGKIQSELRKIGKPTGEFDALIAAVARSRDDILVTNNIKDFINIPNLKLDNWLEN